MLRRNGYWRALCQYRPHVSLANLRAMVLSVLRQGILDKARLSYWKFLRLAAMRHRRSFGAAMTMAVMGDHFKIITRQISGAEG